MFVAELTGLLDLHRWQQKIPELRIIVRDEPLHPRYRTRATDRDKQLARRYQLIAINATVGQLCWLDARHRSHVHVENDVTRAKDPGMNRWPSRRWAITVAWTQLVALTANLLACFRHLTLPAGQLRDAAPQTAALPATTPARPADPSPTQTMATPTHGLALVPT